MCDYQAICAVQLIGCYGTSSYARIVTETCRLGFTICNRGHGREWRGPVLAESHHACASIMGGNGGFVGFTFVATVIETPMASTYQAPDPFVRQHPEALYDALFVVGTTSTPIAIVMVLGAVLARFGQARGRERLQIDRRFFRSKYDAERMLSQFAETARGETELDNLGQELLTVVGETMQPQNAWLWLRGENGDESLVVTPERHWSDQSRAS